MAMQDANSASTEQLRSFAERDDVAALVAEASELIAETDPEALAALAPHPASPKRHRRTAKKDGGANPVS